MEKNRCMKLDIFFEINADMLCCSNREGYFFKVNQAFEDVLGYPAQELTSKRLIDLIHPDDLESALLADRQLKAGRDVRGLVVRCRCKDGSYKDIEWRSAPREGLVYSAARDVTNRQPAQRLRDNTLRRYESLHRISGYDPDNERDLLAFILSEAVKLTESRQGHIFYYDEKSGRVSLEACSGMRADCRCPDIRDADNRELRDVIRERRPVIVNRADPAVSGFCRAAYPRIRNRLLVPVFAQNKIVSIIGVYNKESDYDEPDSLQILLFMRSAWELVLRRRVERELIKEKKWFETTLLSINDGVIATDTSGWIRVVNARARALTSSRQGDIVGRNITDIFKFHRKSDHSEVSLSVSMALRPEKDRTESFLFASGNGNIVHLEIDVSGITSPDPSVLGYLFILRDVTQKSEDEEKIIFLTYHDKLTGLYNRRFFEEEIRRLDIDRYYPLSIISGDVNGLKLANDAFGHLAGDELLVAAADAMKEVCGKSDVAARWGGDEFSILLPNTGVQAAAEIVERIREKCAETSVRHISLSISLGFATKEKAGDDMMEVLKRADDMMYKSKLLESRSIKNSAVKTILRTLHEKNPREEIHSNQVSVFCRQIGASMGLSNSQITDLELLGKIHDIGKISVDESLLNKSGRLSPDEYEAIKRHSEAGYHIISASPELSYLANDVLYHHERWDGTGYPNGLKGKDIPLMARILSAADAFEAMTGERPYRKSLTPADAAAELEKNASGQFDPDIVAAFVRSLRQTGTR